MYLKQPSVYTYTHIYTLDIENSLNTKRHTHTLACETSNAETQSFYKYNCCLAIGFFLLQRIKIHFAEEEEAKFIYPYPFVWEIFLKMLNLLFLRVKMILYKK